MTYPINIDKICLSYVFNSSWAWVSGISLRKLRRAWGFFLIGNTWFQLGFEPGQIFYVLSILQNLIKSTVFIQLCNILLMTELVLKEGYSFFDTLKFVLKVRKTFCFGVWVDISLSFWCSPKFVWITTPIFDVLAVLHFNLMSWPIQYYIIIIYKLNT